MNNLNYGQLIKSIRKDKGISTEEMIQRTRLSEFELAWLENRKVCYSPHAHFIIADALGYSFAKLMKAGGCIDDYKDEEHVRWVFERMVFEEDIKSLYHTSNVDDLDEGSIKNMNSIFAKAFNLEDN